MLRHFQRFAIVASAGITLSVTVPTWAAKPTAEQALELAPVQKDVPYQRPAKDDATKCVVEAVSDGGASGWTVRDPSGLTLRRFLDTNQDNKLDLWCYFRDGIEVYRDVDSNFNGKADEYRWLGTAGTRWGIDANEDGKPDSWNRISPEEATAEVVAALRDKDAPRFVRLLITPEELDALGLSEAQTRELKQKIENARAGFAELARRQKVVNEKTSWTNFGATQPGVLAAGSAGSTKDVVAYENVAAVIETDGKHGQLPIGTLVQVGANWRLIDLPVVATDDKVASGTSGYFFSTLATPVARPQTAEVSAEFQQYADELNEIEKLLAKATTPEKLAELNAKRADVVEKLYETAPNDTEQDNWLRQLADTLSAAVQSGHYDDGVDRLGALADKLAEKKAKTEHVGYVRFRHLMAEYGRDMQDPTANFAKTHSTWIERLETFVKDFPATDDTPEALLQLAIAHEVDDKSDSALRWYGQIVRDFPKSDVAKKAAGAKRRLEYVGQVLTLAGRSLDGKSLDLAALRGNVVVIHYWSTSCEPCKEDMARLRDLQAKYAKQKLAILGVNLDSQVRAPQDYLRSARFNWPQLHEPGGPEGRLATELGVFTLPMMLLVDKDGRLVNGNLHVGELDGELAKLFRDRATTAKPKTGTTPARK